MPTPHFIHVLKERTQKINWHSLSSQAKLYGLALSKIPMILWLTPKLQLLEEERCQILIPLNYRSKNHLGSLYFGALCVGADLAAGLLAHKLTSLIKRQKNIQVSLVFKDFRCQFLRRPEQDTTFLCEDGKLIQECLNRCLESKSREHCTVKVTAFTDDSLQLPHAQFHLTLSLKPQLGKNPS